MAKIVGLPKLSPTMDEGTLVKWTKAEGDLVAVDDLLAEVETDKATMEFRSFDAGTLLKILVPEGETLAPDTPVAIIGQAGEDISSLAGQTGGAAAQTATASHTPAPTDANPAPPASLTTPAGPVGGGRVLASPLVRRLARERNLDLRQVAGSGPGGRVIKRDIDGLASRTVEASPSAADASSSTASAPAAGLAAPRVEKLSQMRKTIARRLTESKQQIPHFYLSVDVDAQPVWDWRKQINAALADSGDKVSFNDLVVKAVATALQQNPAANASFMGDSVHYHQRVDISVAVAIPDGLVTPVVRDADKKGVHAISREIRDLAGRAKDKKLTPEEMQNGTFSVSNLGMYGIEDFQAVINPPEGAILAVGALRQEPVVNAAGNVVAGRRMRLTLSCDHRVIDGAVGAAFLQTLQGLLEQPLKALL